MENSKSTHQEISMNPLLQNRYETQQNAVFIDYSSQSLISAFHNYKNLNTYERNAFAKNINSIKSALIDSKAAFYEFLLLLTSDSEANQSQLISFLKEEYSGGRKIQNLQKEMIQPLLALISNAHLEIKQQSCYLLIQIAHSMTIQDRQIIVKFASDLSIDEMEESKIISIQLICRLAQYLPQTQVEKYFTTQYLSIYDNSTLRIKKEVIINCAIIGRYVSDTFFDLQILDTFSQKCKESVPAVRKSCAEILPQLLSLTKAKKTMLSNILLSLVKDGHKIVRLTACKIVPQFLAKYGCAQIPEALFEFYLGLSDHDINKMVNRQNEILYPIAYYFTAILQLVGSKEWHKMNRLFNKLLFCKNQEINLPLVSSLHEIAKVIGPSHSKEFLFPAFNNIFQRQSDLLRLASISHFSTFVSVFQNATRESLIDIFMVLQSNSNKWRMRVEIARQLKNISAVYEAETLFRYIFPITLKLCNDLISCVREEAAVNMFYVIDGMRKDKTYENIAQQSLKGFGLSKQYVQRQTFARMVLTLHKLPDFQTKYFSIVLALAQDQIILVKYSLIISVVSILKDFSQKTKFFKPIMDKLREDEQIRQNFDLQ